MAPLLFLPAVLCVLFLRCHAYQPPLLSRDVPAADLLRFESWVQYAAAAYCNVNIEAKHGAKVSCPLRDCPFAEDADTVLLLSFKTQVTDTAGFLALDHTHRAIVLAFRGTASIRNLVLEFDPLMVETDLCDKCMPEQGFWVSWTAVRTELLQAVNQAITQYPNYEIVMAGHSLGAALATLAAAEVRWKGNRVMLYSYGSPRIGNPALATSLTAQTGNYRITHTDDPIPKLPLLEMGYVHLSPEYWITTPDNATVRPDQIQVLTGLMNMHGNTGTGPPLLKDVHAHFWYFQFVTLCVEPIPF